MPQQSSPPYLSTASIWPRQINRWLDINAQNGSLQRTQTYITLPAFNLNNNWSGYSNLIAAYNFEGPNNFSLTSLSSIVAPNTSYLLCIMWIDKNNCVHRYALWTGVGEVMYIPYNLYTGQLIGKNFRLEIWTTGNSNNQVQPTPINFYTSKLGIQDYRHGVDSVLVGSDAVVTNFSVGVVSMPPVTTLPVDVGLIFRVDSTFGLFNDGGLFIRWESSIAPNPTLTIQGASGSMLVSNSNTPSGLKQLVISNNEQYLFCGLATAGIQLMVLACKITGTQAVNTPLFSAYDGGISIQWANGTATAGTQNINGLSLNQWYIFVYYLNGAQATLSVYDLLSSSNIATVTGIAPVVTESNGVVLGNCDVDLLEAFLGTNSPSNADLTQIVQYLTYKYADTALFDLPLVFPGNSAPEINNI